MRGGIAAAGRFIDSLLFRLHRVSVVRFVAGCKDRYRHGGNKDRRELHINGLMIKTMTLQAYLPVKTCKSIGILGKQRGYFAVNAPEVSQKTQLVADSVLNSLVK